MVSLRQFTNNAFTHHHGMQSEERFGNIDEDGDGFVSELTRADITAVTVYQAALPVPGRVTPDDPEAAKAARIGEARLRRSVVRPATFPRFPWEIADGFTRSRARTTPRETCKSAKRPP